MSSEVFRFVTIRPPQQVDTVETSDNAVDLGMSKSSFTDSLRKLRITESRANMVGAATKFIGSADFIDSSRKLDKTVLDFTTALQRLPEEGFWNGASQAFTRIFSAAPVDFVKRGAFTKPYVQTADSIVAATIDGSVSPKVRSLLVRSARTLWLIRRLADAVPVS
jgi:hypothetical protein